MIREGSPGGIKFRVGVDLDISSGTSPIIIMNSDLLMIQYEKVATIGAVDVFDDNDQVIFAANTYLEYTTLESDFPVGTASADWWAEPRVTLSGQEFTSQLAACFIVHSQGTCST